MKKLILLCVLILPVFGCTTLEAWQANPKVQFAEAEVADILLNYFSNGGNADTAWSFTQGIRTIGDTADFLARQKQGVTPSVTIAKTIKEFADDPTAINTLASQVSKLVAKAAPQTPAQSAALTQALASEFTKVLLAQAP